jgi:glycerol-3-phosphate dehydrogenase (NAD(P)+)
LTRVGVVGTTSWGTTLSILLANKGVAIALLALNDEEARQLQEERENSLLPGHRLPDLVTVCPDPAEALRDCDMVILVVPSQTMRQNLRWVRECLPRGAVLLSAAKGLESETAQRMSQVMASELPEELQSHVCVLSGPNLAGEIARGFPATTVVASHNRRAAERAQEILMTPLFRVYTHFDVIGVELGGALKNIIALGAGIADAWGYGDNPKAAFLTRGLAEITRLGVAAGANPLTFSGLAGLGDLIATCYSPLSRNRYVGQELGKGRSVQEITAGMQHVAEGIPTTVAARLMARRLGVEMPITEQMYRVLFEGLDARQAVMELMAREPKHELAGIGPAWP